MRESESQTSQWQIPLIVALGIILVVFAAVLLTQIDGLQRRSVLPPKRLPVIDLEGTVAAGELGIIYLPGDERITATPSVTPVTILPTPLATPLATAVSVLVPTCEAVPKGWTAYIVKQGDTLSSLAIKYSVSKNAIVQANCLAYEHIIQGQQIYLPQDGLTQVFETKCGAPQGWIHYVVHPDDTLLKLAEEYGSTVFLIMNANCLESTYLAAGRKLFLPPSQTPPPIPTRYNPTPTRRRPLISPTPNVTRPFIPTATATPIIITASPSATQTLRPTETNTVTPPPNTPTATPLITPSVTSTDAPFPTPSATPTETPSPSPTSTPSVPTATITPTQPPPTATSSPIPPSPTATSVSIPPSPTATSPVHPPAQPTSTATVDPYPS